MSVEQLFAEVQVNSTLFITCELTNYNAWKALAVHLCGVKKKHGTDFDVNI